MKRVVLLGLLAVGCGGVKTTPVDAAVDLGVPDGIVDLAPPLDLFVGRYDCPPPLDEYCGREANCLRRLSDAVQPDAGCEGLGVVAESSGSYVYITSHYGGSDLGAAVSVSGIMVYDAVSGALVAILFDGPAGNSQCIAGPAVFDDPGLLQCPGAPSDPTNRAMVARRSRSARRSLPSRRAASDP
jgi:hypothetical protein